MIVAMISNVQYQHKDIFYGKKKGDFQLSTLQIPQVISVNWHSFGRTEGFHLAFCNVETRSPQVPYLAVISAGTANVWRLRRSKWRNIWVSPQNPVAEMAWNGLKCLETCWNHHVFCFLAVLAIDCRWLEARASWRCWHMLARDFCSTSCHFLTWASSYPTFHSGFFHSHGGMVRKGCNLAETQRAPWWWHCSFCSTTIEHHNGPHRFMMRAHLRIISTFMYATLYARMYTPIPLNTFSAMCAVSDDIWVCLKQGVHGAHPRNWRL